MARMSRDDALRFLAEGARTGKLAVTRRDGSPHVMPIWFVLDGDEIVFTTGRDTIKGKSIRRTGRAAMCADDERPPFAFVSVSGPATYEDNPPEMLEWATKIAARYMGDEAEAYGKRNAVEGELLVRLKPERIRRCRLVTLKGDS